MSESDPMQEVSTEDGMQDFQFDINSNRQDAYPENGPLANGEAPLSVNLAEAMKQTNTQIGENMGWESQNMNSFGSTESPDERA